MHCAALQWQSHSDQAVCKLPSECAWPQLTHIANHFIQCHATKLILMLKNGIYLNQPCSPQPDGMRNPRKLKKIRMVFSEHTHCERGMRAPHTSSLYKGLRHTTRRRLSEAQSVRDNTISLGRNSHSPSPVEIFFHRHLTSITSFINWWKCIY